MTPAQIERLLRTVAVIVAALALWWAWDSFTGWVRAPVMAELAKATKANDSLVVDLDRERALNDKLSATLLARAKREGKVDAKVDAMRAELRALMESDPAARDLLNKRLPDGLFRKEPPK